MVYVKEIPAFRVHPKFDGNNVTFTTEMYTLLLPHLHKDFRNKENEEYAAVSCFPPFPYTETIEEVFIEYLKNNIKSQKTKIIFDNVYEGHTVSCIDGIHKLIKKMSLNPNNCYFVSGGMQAHVLYDKYCEKFNIHERINIIVLNSWERHIFLATTCDGLQHINFEIKNKEKLFLCFNRVIRAHRIALLGMILEKNLIDKSFYSFFPQLTHGTADTLGFDHYLSSNLSPELKSRILDQLNKNIDKFPLLLNNNDGSNTNRVLKSDIEYYQKSYFSLVTETFFFSDPKNENLRWEERSVFFSEKIFKPIICKHPFILVSRPKSLEYLKKIGYETFHPYIDETYDTIEDDQERFLAIINEVERLAKYSDEEWLTWLQNVAAIVEHNYNVICSKSVDEFLFIER